MEASKKLAVGAIGFVVVLGAIFLLMQGGDEDPAPDGDADPGASAGTHDCQTGGFGQEQGEWGGVACHQASGAETFTDTFPCETPDQSAVAGSLQNATAGSLTVNVEDSAGAVVFEDTYEAGTHPVGDFVGQGEAGEWTVTVELSDDWESQEFGIGAGCESGGGGSGGPSSGSEACQTSSDVETAGMSFGQIRCTDKQGEDTLEATFQCADPSQGSVNWDADMDAGEVTLTVLDADGQATVEETFSGDDQGGAPLGSGATGEWTVRTELSSDFQGSFYTQAGCQAG